MKVIQSSILALTSASSAYVGGLTIKIWQLKLILK